MGREYDNKGEDVMKILLRKGHHSVYDDLVRFPPSGIQYTIPGSVTQSKSKKVDHIKKRLFSAYVHYLKKPHEIYVNTGKTDLIHACSGILIKNKFPWVIDTEHVSSFVGFEAGRLDRIKHKVERMLASDYCKKIMPWSEAGRKSIVNGLDTRKFKDKIEVVYPAMNLPVVKKKKHDDLNLLFVSVRFFTKGGREILEAYDKLTKKYDFKLNIISDVPADLRNKYKTDDNINFYKPNIPRKKLLDDFYSTTDIFVLPSYMDTFGMVFLEAMSYKMPVITTNAFAIPEILGKSGLFVNIDRFSWYGRNYLFAWDSWEKFSKYCETGKKPDVVKELIKHTSTLIENKSLRERMGRMGRKEVESGKFSIKARNSKLKKIYEEAAR